MLNVKKILCSATRTLVIVYTLITTANPLHAQVNLQTGSATFSLPMFNWQDDKSRLNAVVALNYSSGSGLKVSEVASSVGQGWNLTAGGVITRMQVGEPDDQVANDGDGTIEDVTKYPPGYLYNPFAGTGNGCPKALAYYPIFGDENHIYKQHNSVSADRELDYFSFDFNGRTGVFVLDKSSFNTTTGTGGVLLIGDSKLKVTFQITNNMTHGSSGIRTTISSFTIQDENGVIYKFAHIGLTKVLRTNYCDAALNAKQTQPKFKDNYLYNEADFDLITVNPYIINQWFLTEIDDALVPGRAVTLTYSDRDINSLAGAQISFNANKNYSLVSNKRTIGVSPAISTISFPDGHGVLFNYGAPRVDLVGDLPLSKVDISYKGRPLAEYQLTTSYFILNRYGNPITAYEKSVARLCLVSVKKIGVDLKSDEQPYIFDYYLGTTASADDVVPPPFYYKKDIWGFYNGNNSTDYYGNPIDPTTPVTILKNWQALGLCFLRDNPAWTPLNNPKPKYAQNGLLKQIIYPTGGSLQYIYDQNKAKIGTAAQTDVGGVHVSQISVADGGYSNGCSNPLITNYSYVDAAGTSSLWGVEQPVTLVNTESPYAPEYKYYHYSFPFGGCKYHYSYPGIISREDQVALTPAQQFMQVFSKVMDIVDIITTIIDVSNLCAGADGALLSVIIDVIAGVLDIVLSCWIDESRDNPATIYYNLNLNETNPLPSQFSRVEVVNQNSTVTGKTVYEFTSPTSLNYPVWEPTNPTYSMKQRFAYWAYGLPQLTTVLDATNNIIEQTENIYDVTTYGKERYCTNVLTLMGKSRTKTSSPNASAATCSPCTNCEIDQSCKCYVTITSSKRNTIWADPNFYNNPDGSSYTTVNMMKDGNQTVMAVDFYDIYTGRTLLTDTKHRVYKKGDNSQFVQTIEHFDYDLNNYQVNKIATTQTNGDINYKELTYTADYPYYNNDYQELSTLCQKNILNIPVATTSSVLKNGDITPLYLSETITEFKTNANGDIKPARKLEQRTDHPLPASSWTVYQVDNNGYNGSSFEITQLLTYDANDNLIGLKDEGNHIVTNIYGYNDKYTIASVINADPVLDKPAYTSFETRDVTQDFVESRWTLTGPANFITNNTAPTGTVCFGLTASNYITATQLNTLKPYRLSFWATNAVTVTGNATLVKSAPVINGFTYYEYNIAQGTATVKVAGTANIDELRLYPAAARVRSVTYDPLVGKTSECDENNRIVYYEYEELGRLQFIKDEDRNIIKMYEYNVVSNKTGGCPTQYSSHGFSEVFTKQGCAAGYVGANLTYSVPPGQFTSLISQFDADMKAEAYILSMGQAAANSAPNACLLLYLNTARSVPFTTHSCSVGYAGGTVYYNVPAGRYVSTVSQADAEQMADDDVSANGQAYANEKAHAVCTQDNTPDWEADDPAQTQCEQVGNLNTGHQLVLMTDINPFSTTYNTTQWKDAGFNATACPVSLALSGVYPSLVDQGHSTKSGSGYITGTSGAVVHVTVSLHSSDAGATLTGIIGGVNVNLSGAGTHTSTFDITIPSAGYVTWSLTLSGTITGNGYVSSNISISY